MSKAAPVTRETGTGPGTAAALAPWAVGLAVALVLVGPGLAPGPWLSLDLLVTPEIPVPSGLVGLGPALSQRVPLFGLFAIGSWAVGGPVAVKVLVVALVTAGFVGAGRLVGPHGGPAARAAAGVLWAAGPLVATRLGVGHLSLLWLVALLPWLLGTVVSPSASPRRTFLAVLALAVGGPAVGTLAVFVVAVALVAEPRGERRPLPVAVAAGTASLVWVAPTAVLLWAGAEVGPAGDFATRADGVAGWVAVLVGGGFWQTDYQVGSVGLLGAVAGIGLLTLALLGRRDLPDDLARLGPVAVVALALAVASAVPVVRDGYRWVTLLPVGAPLRESQRFLILWLVWLAPAAALGGRRLARAASARVGDARLAGGIGAVAIVAPLALVLAVAVPGWWGVEGRLAPVEFPAGWAEVRDTVRADPGPVVALPWNQYPTLSFAEGRTVFNPLPDYLGGDVISSYDPLFDPEEPRQEQVDRRAWEVDGLAADVVAGEDVAPALGELGVRWVVLAKEGPWGRYAGLGNDPGLDLVLDLPDIRLYAVDAWAGGATAPDGVGHDVERPTLSVLRTSAPPGSVLHVAGAPGWVRGWATPVPVTGDGQLELPAGSGPVWFWPAPVLLGLYAALAATAVVVGVRLRREGAPGPVGETGRAHPCPDGYP